MPKLRRRLPKQHLFQPLIPCVGYLRVGFRASQQSLALPPVRADLQRPEAPSDALFSSLALPGDVEKAVTELIIDFDVNPEEESPYEALYNATSCHSLDSLASGRSSDRESMNKEAEGAGLKAAGVRPVRSCVCLSPLALER